MKSKVGAVAIIVSSVALLGAVLYFANANKPKPVDPNTGCTGRVTSKTVILLDHSEDISDQTKSEILSRVNKRISEEIKKNELVSIYYVAELSQKKLTPEFSRCKPMPPEETNQLTQSEKLIRKTYQEQFLKPLQEVITRKIAGANQSPIAQALVDISLLSQLKDAEHSRLLIFSDMIENSKGKFSMYSQCGLPKQELITNYRTSVGTALARPSFANLQVELHLIPRENTRQQIVECRNFFWSWFFGDMTGDSKLIKFDLPGS